MAKKKNIGKRERAKRKLARESGGGEEAHASQSLTYRTDLSSRGTRSGDQSEENKRTLHVTQLPYDIVKSQLLTYFLEAGCPADDCRLVMSGNKFSGGAFLVASDVASCRAGIKLHRSKIKGRTINVRMFKTPEELAAIAKKRDDDLLERGLLWKAAQRRKVTEGEAVGAEAVGAVVLPVVSKEGTKRKRAKDTTAMENKPGKVRKQAGGSGPKNSKKPRLVGGKSKPQRKKGKE
eukprot:CAMPEP_0185746816 /NCGR_PEP_ID=MMETSP1174-20130828/5473_1 /TAXON_ID=35687 /ORGANISM="Dictyocha speculum, Strain CCMP1381" /LENGTH=234 /DNA_ID=CAMNT_0028421727 /DNA_START=30 /DNA_END=734 /DNA_ORIENTATION=-